MKNYTLTKRACCFAYVATSAVFALPPLLFAGFHELYGISYTLLGTLVMVNFITQLSVDLIFSFFSRFFNIEKTIRAMPLVTTAGFLVYGLSPILFPDHVYAGLLVGTVIFSMSGGLCEVLISPTVAACPSDTPERDMSTLHSLYAYGFVSVVVLSTIFLRIFGNERWMYLSFFFAALPIVAAILFALSPIPDMQPEKAPDHRGRRDRSRSVGIALCMLCIFLGAAAENSMTNWISVYFESALKLPKIVGDILGMSLFALLLGLTRTLYAKKGKNVTRVLMCGMLGSAILYVTIAVCPYAWLSVAACVLMGVCVAMLWPGTLILMEENVRDAGVVAYALMAAGGDFGSSVVPQLVGALIDKVAASESAAELSATLGISAEQLGMKTGMLVSALFPLAGFILLILSAEFSIKIKTLDFCLKIC